MGDALALTTWLRDNAHRLRGVDPEGPLDDLEPLGEMIADARVVGLGEAAHAVGEYYLLKHRIFRFLVERLGFTVFALESGLPEGRKVDRWVAGDLPVEDLDDVLRTGFTYNMGCCQEFADQLTWMREVNQQAGHPRLRYRGADMPGWLASPKVAVGEVLGFLDTVDPETASWARHEVVPLTDQVSQRFVTEAIAHHRGLPSQVRDDLTVRLADLTNRVRFGRVHHTRKVGAYEYEWALRCAEAAQQLDAHFREAGRFEGDAFEANARETAIADNVRWMLDVVDRGERVAFGAHNGHLQRTPFVPVGMTSEAGPAGAYLDAMLGTDYLPIGTTFGSIAAGKADAIVEDADALPGPAPAWTIDAVLSGLGEPVLAVDLRAAVAAGGEVATDLAAIDQMRAQNFVVTTDLAAAFDVLIHVDVIGQFTPRAVERDDA